MVKTDEQREADKALEEAIHKCCAAYKLMEDPEFGEPQMMGDYLCIIEGLKFDNDGDLSEDFYSLVLPSGNLSTAKAKGLCHHAIDMLTHGRQEE